MNELAELTQRDLTPPLLPALLEPEKLELSQLNLRLREYQILQTKRPLEASETREAIELIHIVRRVNSTSGPKKEPKARKGKMSIEDFEKQFE